MITFEKQENGVLFTFENSDKYLYGDGTILVPFNSLAVIQDESDMITLRKSASWDIFLSGRYDTDFGYASKEEAVNALKEILYDEAGISEEEVQEMIDAATSGIPSSEVVEQLRRDVNTVSGEVDTKQDILTAGDNITISGNVISADNNIIELTQAEYDALTEKDPDALYIITDAQEINMNNYYTKSEVDASIATKADASALTAVNDALTAHTADTNVHFTGTQKSNYDGLEAQYYVDDNWDVMPMSVFNDFTNDYSTAMGQFDQRISANTSAVTAVSNNLNTLSGKVDSKVDTTTYESGQYATAQALNALQENKLDASAYTPTDLSEYWTSGQTQEAINAATSGIPSSQVVEQLRTDVNTVSGDVQTNASNIADIWDTIDDKEEVIASALTQLNQDVADIDAKEEVIASALTEVRQDVENKQDVLSAGTGIEISGNVISATGGVLFVNFDDLMENMNDEKWDELVDAIQNKKPIFYGYDGSEGDTTDAEQSPVEGNVFINQTEGEEESLITLNRLYSGGYNSLIITKFDSEDYEVTDESGDYQPYGDYQPLLQAGSGISIDENNVISVTGGSSVTVDSAITSASTNAVENRAIYNKVTMEVGDPTIIEYDDVPVTATTSGSRYYKVEFNDEGQGVSFLLEDEDGMILDDTGIMRQMGIPVSDSIVTVTEYQVYLGVGYEVAFSDEYNVEEVTANGGASLYVGHKGTSTEWVKDVVADLLETVSGKADTSAVTAAIDAAITGKVDTSAITSSITSGSTDAEIPTAKATYDAIQSGGGGATSGITYDTPFIASGAFLHGQWYGFILDYGSIVVSLKQYVRLNVNGSLVSIGVAGDTNIYDGSGNLIDTPSYINQDLNIWDSTNKRRYLFFKDGVYIDYIANASGLKYTLYTETNSGEVVELIQDHIFNDAVHTTSSEKTLWNTVSEKVDTSAITSAMTSSSTDAQVPSAKAVHDQFGGLKLVKLTQAEYDALATKDSSTLYIISD